MIDRFAVERNASQWKVTGASADEIAKCGGALECWTWYPFDDQPVAVQVTEGDTREWNVRTEEPLGPADDAVVARHVDASRGLLVALLDAMAREVPAVMAVPESDFPRGSHLFAMVDFARRALPGTLRRRCRIRCFAKNLAKYFDEFHADLLVIPQNLLTQAAGLRRDALMLGPDGQRISVDKERYADYGRFVCERLVKDPATFEEFALRLNRFIPELPTAQQTNLIPLLDALSRGDQNVDIPQGLESLDVNWPAAIEPGDWRSLTTASVYRMALGVDTLRDDALREIERRKEQPPSYLDWDGEMSKRPAVATDLLLASSRWQDWRNRTALSAPELRQAALNWCGSTYWQSHEPFLEDWVQILRDLKPSVSSADLRVMQGSRETPFPPITFFDDRQSRDVAGLSSSTPKPVVRASQDETVVLPGAEWRPPVVLFGASSVAAAQGSRRASEWHWKDGSVHATASEAGGDTFVVILTEESGPRQATLLEQGSRPRVIVIEYPRAEIRLKAGQVLLLPATADAERRLPAFVDDLTRVPRELRRNLLATVPESQDTTPLPSAPVAEESESSEENSGFLGSVFNWRKRK